ncbi:N-acetylmuramoyl-L-alanine amidase [Corynebacterium terpenotabidum]|uniref:Putative hydrolase n=1 Tax=Corynebacterium terpenotabidum Y-11 TaxID=1200352 RepID=S4XHG6_9CORY|nr:N-acetylmuramoyl-L-alanine amidase [Corynebacterium terpenotabidum]AGP32019.1 putative hydrolase [Corynebacterium terpenotabidum Y-11]
MYGEVYRPGDRGARVAEVRGTLARLGFIDGFSGDATGEVHQQLRPEDELFDSTLETALRAFQQQRGIIADGHITNGTLRALREASYSLGSRVLMLQAPGHYLVGDDVSDLQKHLHDLGFFTSRVDGHFGPLTHQALKNYQFDAGLTSDGVLGPETLRSLSYLGRRITGGSPQAIREQEQIRAAGPQLTGKRIVLDPAFGGASTGRLVQGRYGQLAEEEILWDLATRTEGRMIAAGMETIVSRPRSDNPSSMDRVAMANAFGADLMISLHCDCYTNEKAHGAATFYYGSESGSSSMTGERLAGLIQREIAARTPLTDNHAHGRTWDVLRLTKMPTVQVNAGYITNPEDVSLLTDPSVRDTIAEALVVAVKRLYLLDKDAAETGQYSFSELLAEEGRSHRRAD